MRILKKIGRWALYVVIGIIASPFVVLLLIILGILLCGRIKYDIKGRVGAENDAHVDVRYFMRLVHVVFTHKDGKSDTKVRVAWMRLGEEKPKPKQKKPNRKKQKDSASMAATPHTQKQAHTIKNATTDVVGADLVSARASEDCDASPHTTPKSTDSNLHVVGAGSSRPSLAEKHSPGHTDQPSTIDISSGREDPAPTEQGHAISADEGLSKPPSQDDKAPTKDEKTSPKALFTKAKAIWNYPARPQIITLTLQALKKFFRALKPKRFQIHGVIGTDDPATTAYVMGAYEAAMGILQLHQHIKLYGNYHEKALELDIQAKGRARLGRLLWPFLWLYLKKPVRTVIHKYLL
ncbi:MAG: hypothetical protein FWC93_08525 [Defluviitaleaceae bacterium]|nr:hypothetical protein [Defluviitaleaceae bacterium]